MFTTRSNGRYEAETRQVYMRSDNFVVGYRQLISIVRAMVESLV